MWAVVTCRQCLLVPTLVQPSPSLSRLTTREGVYWVHCVLCVMCVWCAVSDVIAKLSPAGQRAVFTCWPDLLYHEVWNPTAVPSFSQVHHSLTRGAVCLRAGQAQRVLAYLCQHPEADAVQLLSQYRLSPLWSVGCDAHLFRALYRYACIVFVAAGTRLLMDSGGPRR